MHVEHDVEAPIKASQVAVSLAADSDIIKQTFTTFMEFSIRREQAEKDFGEKLEAEPFAKAKAFPDPAMQLQDLLHLSRDRHPVSLQFNK